MRNGSWVTLAPYKIKKRGLSPQEVGPLMRLKRKFRKVISLGSLLNADTQYTLKGREEARTKKNPMLNLSCLAIKRAFHFIRGNPE